MGARLSGGAIVDDIETDDGRHITVHFERCPAGWQATFELTHPEVDDLAVVHRLVASTLADARSSVPHAVNYLSGVPLD